MARNAPGSDLPFGTVTFVLTDVDLPTAPALLATRRGVRLPGRTSGGANGGGAAVVFASAADAVAATLDLQRAFDPAGGDGPARRARIGIHTGEARPADGRSYARPALQRCARLRDVAHAGQTLLTAVTASIVGDALPRGGWLRDMIVARALPGLAAAHRRLGDIDAARAHLERALELGRRLDLPRIVADALYESAVLVAVDDPDRAESLNHEALAIRVAHGLRTFYVDSLDALATLAARAGSNVEATRLYAASDTGRKLMGRPRPPVDRADHVGVVAALGASLGADGFDAAWSEGAALSLDDAVAYVSRARGARGRPSTGWASLTPTEHKVVGLAAEGLTNPEIAARLFISRDTVKTHLSHIYAKLDVTNRTELATLAASRE